MLRSLVLLLCSTSYLEIAVKEILIAASHTAEVTQTVA